MAKDNKLFDMGSNSDHKGMPVHGLYGLGMLFVAVSIGYANYLVYFGTEDLLSKLMLIPSTLFVVIFGVYKSLK